MTKAIDIVTIVYALLTLEKKFLGLGRTWVADGNDEQKQLFEFYRLYSDIIEQVKDLKAKASNDWEVLNDFLAKDNFDPMFDGPLDGIGVVSILDKFVKWLAKGKTCNIRSAGSTYPGFELGENNFLFHDVKHSEHPLVELITQSDDRLFLIMDERSLDGIEMFDFALEVMNRKQAMNHPYSAVQMPKVDFDIKPDISFLIGANTRDIKDEYWLITQAFQQFKFRMNEEGARARVATGLGMTRGIAPKIEKLVLDKPFYGWFIQKGINVPIAVFYADRDCWKEPSGTLEDL